MKHKITDFSGQSLRNEDNSSKNLLHYPPPGQGFFSVFCDPDEAVKLLIDLFQEFNLINDDGTVQRSVAIVSIFYALQTKGGVIHPSVRCIEFQRLVFDFFNTEFKEQKRQRGNNDFKYNRYRDMTLNYLNKRFS